MRAGSEPDKTYTERKDKKPPKVSAQEKSLFLELKAPTGAASYPK